MVLFSLAGLLLFVALGHTQNIEDKKIVCYYTSWSVYRTNQYVFRPTQISPFLCTHIIYAFGAFDKDNKLKPFDEYQDITKGGYRDVTNIKSVNSNLKVLLSLGGGREGSKNFSPIAASTERRIKFCKNAVDYLRKHNFDGLSLDWQYPALKEGSRTEDKENYILLVEALRYEFVKESLVSNASQLMISLTVPAREEYIERGYNLMKLQEFVDIVNIAAYDYHYPYEPSVYHHSQLYPLPEEVEGHQNSNLNVVGTLKYLQTKGANLFKYTLGIPVYGRTFKLQDRSQNDLGSPSKAQGTAGTGIRAYYDVCSYSMDSKWTVKTPNATAMGPYMYRGEDWICYDDEEIVRRKGAFSVENGLAGIMFWALDTDDFRGDCSAKPYPILNSGRAGLEEGLNRLRAATSTTTTTTTTPATTTTTEDNSIQSEVITKDLADNSPAKIISQVGTPSLKANISAIANKSASLAAEILKLSNFSTTVLLDNSTGGERMARLDSVIFKEEKNPTDETIHTFQPQYGLELGGKLNQSHFYSIKIWIINNLFHF